jgi:hypothetical protein
MELQQIGHKTQHVRNTQSPAPRLRYLCQTSNGFTKALLKVCMYLVQCCLIHWQWFVEKYMAKEAHCSSTTMVTGK